LQADNCCFFQGFLDAVARCSDSHRRKPVAPIPPAATAAARRPSNSRWSRRCFFALLFAIIETAMAFFASQVLETITQNSARMILTGQAQTAAYTQSQFQAYVCGQIPALFTCGNICVDVQSYLSFSNVAINSQIDGSNNLVNNMQYNPGGSGDIVVVRLFYQWPLVVTGLGYNISNLAGNTRLLTATAAFRNEPY
jgi:Flp pilus assembly protein TadG